MTQYEYDRKIRNLEDRVKDLEHQIDTYETILNQKERDITSLIIAKDEVVERVYNLDQKIDELRSELRQYE